MHTIIRKWGNSAGTIIPAKILHQAGLKLDDAVDIVVVDNQVILSPAVKKQTLEELLALSPAASFEHSEEDKQWLSDPAVGNEVT